MHDFTGERVEAAGPGMPVEVLGFDGVSDAGEFVQAVENDRRARQLAQERANRLKTEALARRQARKVSLDEVFARVQEGDIKELNIVLKADVAGSLEALQDEIAKVPQERVAINIIHSQTGGINESDVMLASASDAIIIGFNVRPAGRRPPRRRARGRRHPHLLGHLQNHRGPAQRDGGPAGGGRGRGGASARPKSNRPSRPPRSAASPAASSPRARPSRTASVRLVREGTVIWTGKLGSPAPLQRQRAGSRGGAGVRRRARRLR